MRETRAALITPSLDYAAAAKADLVIEAVFEDLAVKKAVFRALDKVHEARRDSRHQHLDARRRPRSPRSRSVRATCSACISSVPPTSCGCWKWCARRRRGPTCWPRCMSLARRIGKTAVVSGVCDGFIGNRMINPYSQQALLMLEEGASPQQVDARHRKVRFCDGSVPHVGPGRQRHQLAHPQAPLRRASEAATHAHRRSRLRARPFRTEDRARLVSLRSRQARCDSGSAWSTRSSTRNARR